MAKNKHHQLADLMKLQREDRNAHFQATEKEVNFVRFHFYRKRFIAEGPLVECPLMTESALRCMVYTHGCALRLFSRKEELKQQLSSLEWSGMLTEPEIIFQDQILYYLNQPDHWRTPWGIKVIGPQDNKPALERRRDEALLYCASQTELSSNFEEFEKEDEANSLSYQFFCMGAILEQPYRLKQNRLGDPSPIYLRATEAWFANQATDEVTDDIAKTPRKLDSLDFAPKPGQTIALAYEAVLESQRQRRSHHRYYLRKYYREYLEEAIFDGVGWDLQRKNAFLREWELRLREKLGLHNQVSPASKPGIGRWRQAASIDRRTAAKMIQYFVDGFILDPENKKLGEIACLLWVCIWCSIECPALEVTIEKLLELTSADVCSKKEHLTLGPVELKVSHGLYEMLSCLCGIGEGKRKRRLFQHLDVQTLGRELHKASKAVLASGALPILPSAFLAAPHISQEARVPAAMRRQQMARKSPLPPSSRKKEYQKAIRDALKQGKNRA